MISVFSIWKKEPTGRNLIKNVEAGPLVTTWHIAVWKVQETNSAHCWDVVAGSGHVRGGGKATQGIRRG